MARVFIIHETTLQERPALDEWTLWFQWCRYVFDDGSFQKGYRFIWRRPPQEGSSLQAARGQARLPSAQAVLDLIADAKQQGWGDLVAEEEEEREANATAGLRTAPSAA